MLNNRDRGPLTIFRPPRRTLYLRGGFLPFLGMDGLINLEPSTSLPPRATLPLALTYPLYVEATRVWRQSVGPEIQQLLKLQRIDGRLELLKRELELRPKMHSEKKARLELLGEKRLEILSLQREIQVRIDRIDLDAKSIDEKIQDSESKLGNATSNTEYQGFQAQITSYQSARAEIDDQLLAIWEEMEEAKRLEEQCDRVVAEQKGIVEEERGELEKELGSIRDEARALLGDRDNMRGDIEGSILDEYDQLFTRYRERSVVPVDVGICGGCNMTLSPQTLADLKGTKAVHCNNCRRLLYRV